MHNGRRTETFRASRAGRPAAFDRFARHVPRGPRTAVAGADRCAQPHAASAFAVRAGAGLRTRWPCRGRTTSSRRSGWPATSAGSRNGGSRATRSASFGVDCPVRPTRLASIEPLADRWWDPARCDLPARWSPGLPDLVQAKAYLLETLESTLELLEHAAETDAGLYFYRLALCHEDLRGEQLVAMAQALGLPLGSSCRPPASCASRCWCRRRLGAGRAGPRLRLRAGAGPAPGRGAGVRDRRAAGDLGPVRGVRG